NLISINTITQPLKAKAKTRYRQTEQPCTIYPPSENGVYKIVFDQKQRAITQGQAAVLYELENPEIIIGGGTIL
ncbi:MAG: aminomethyltransferase beta-barrel domain-containing protein, partial [Oscillospiraceae bacterium]